MALIRDPIDQSLKSMVIDSRVANLPYRASVETVLQVKYRTVFLELIDGDRRVKLHDMLSDRAMEILTENISCATIRVLSSGGRTMADFSLLQ